MEERAYKMAKSMEGSRRLGVILATTIALVLACAFVTASPSQACAASAQNKAYEAYSDFLSMPTYRWDANSGKTAAVNQPKYYKFAMVDLDGDKVKELIVENTHAYYGVGLGKIFGYKKGKVKELLSLYGGSDCMKVYQKSRVVYQHMARGTTYEYHYAFSKTGKVTTKAYAFGEYLDAGSAPSRPVLGELPSGATAYELKLNGKDVGMEAYQAGLSKILKGSDKTVTLKYCSNTKKNRVKKLGVGGKYTGRGMSPSKVSKKGWYEIVVSNSKIMEFKLTGSALCVTAPLNYATSWKAGDGFKASKRLPSDPYKFTVTKSTKYYMPNDGRPEKTTKAVAKDAIKGLSQSNLGSLRVLVHVKSGKAVGVYFFS